MKLNKALKLSISVLVALPLSSIFGNEILANHLKNTFEYELSTDNLIACGGGGGGDYNGTGSNSNGGSGIVVLRLPTANKPGSFAVAPGTNTVTTTGDCTVATFTVSGTITL